MPLLESCRQPRQSRYGDVYEEGEKLELISLQVSLLVALNNHLEREGVVVNEFSRRAKLPFGQEGCLAHQRPGGPINSFS